MTVKYNILVIAAQFIILTNCAQNAKNGQQSGGNRLGETTSPYLRQHADNPVDWYEWGPDALRKAEEENKPLIISIGYSSCHWCHVMEHESFMDSAVAKIMNENFVSIKIDREERPDIDQIYLNAAQLISGGGGGWPLNAFALPDGSPFYAATYFPKDQWIELLLKVRDLYENDPMKIAVQAENLTQGVKSYEIVDVAPRSLEELDKSVYEKIFDNWKPKLDFKLGGFSNAPKFPLPIAWEFLLQYYYLTNNEKALEIVNTTLLEMAKGGIYDQIAGGFSRYSTDKYWKVPHFEKMLYDNGQLVSLYSQAYKLTQEPLYEEVIRKTLEFIKREMTHEEGGFFSSLNADSEGEEGKFYVWREEEIGRILDESTADLIIDYYEVEKTGNWEDGKNIIHRKASLEDFAEKQNLSAEKWNKILNEANKKLLTDREKRVRPSTDDKILTSWNAIMMNGYIDAYLALGDEPYLETAIKNARFLEEKMMDKNGRLYRSYKDGKARIDAFLDDYAFLSASLISLYEATFDLHWLEKAKLITTYAVDHFRNDVSGMFYYTSEEQSDHLIARKMELTDNVVPSSNSLMAEVLFKLGTYYFDDSFVSMSRTMLSHVVKDITKGGAYYSNWGRLLGMMTYKPYEIAIVGEEAEDKNLELQRHFLPTAIFMGGDSENLPLLDNKLSKGETLIYVCRNRTCKFPVKKTGEALQQMKN